MKSTKATNGVIGVDHQTEPGNNEMEEEISE